MAVVIAETWFDQRGDSDCWIACLASLTGIDIRAFPQPPAIDEWEAKGVEYGNEVRTFLKQCGWLLLKTWRYVPDGFAIANGGSPRGHEWGHAVVVKSGRLVHDPHPSRAGIIEPVEEYEVLIPIHLQPPTGSSK